jgi:hypothetical protein
VQIREVSAQHQQVPPGGRILDKLRPERDGVRGATVRSVNMQGPSKSVRGRNSARPSWRRAKATPLATSGEGGVGDGFRRDIVTQDELGEYRGLKDEVARLNEEIEERRSSMIERLDAGAAIEPGFFHATVSHRKQRMLTAPKLEEILPRAEVERLKSLVTPTYSTHLRVSQMS